MHIQDYTPYHTIPLTKEYDFVSRNNVKESLLHILPVDADRTSFRSLSHRVRFCVASDCNKLSIVSCTSEMSLPSVSVSIIPNNDPSNPVSVIKESGGPSLPSLTAKVKACSLTSPASLVTSCLRQPTAALRSNKCALASVS